MLDGPPILRFPVPSSGISPPLAVPGLKRPCALSVSIHNTLYCYQHTYRYYSGFLNHSLSSTVFLRFLDGNLSVDFGKIIPITHQSAYLIGVSYACKQLCAQPNGCQENHEEKNDKRKHRNRDVKSASWSWSCRPIFTVLVLFLVWSSPQRSLMFNNHFNVEVVLCASASYCV